MAFDGGWQRTLSIRNHIIFFENWCTELLYFSPTHPSQWTLAINFLLFIYFRCLFISFSFWFCCCCCHNFILNIFFFTRVDYNMVVGWLFFVQYWWCQTKHTKKFNHFCPENKTLGYFFQFVIIFHLHFFLTFQNDR